MRVRLPSGTVGCASTRPVQGHAPRRGGRRKSSVGALFIQSESAEYFHALEPGALALAPSLNAKRFLPLDLCYGHEVRAKEYRYLTERDLRADEYDWFRPRADAQVSLHHGHRLLRDNEHSVAADGTITPSGEVFGYYVITKQYFERYRLPVMHAETNLDDAERVPAWLWKQWANLTQLKNDGVPIIGFTWYGLGLRRAERVDVGRGIRPARCGRSVRQARARRAPYYERPEEFAAMMRHAIAVTGSCFNTHRMVQQYVTHAYFD